jgi:uncharacterized cupin superfamily protein
MKIEVKKLSVQEIEKLGIKDWPIWEKEASTFDWHYDEKEMCYFLEGDVEVSTESGEKVKCGKGDFVTFPRGLACRWNIKKAVRKHYKFE